MTTTVFLVLCLKLRFQNDTMITDTNYKELCLHMFLQPLHFENECTFMMWLLSLLSCRDFKMFLS